MRGRKPKPVEQKLREGNAGHRPLPEPLQLGRASVEKPDDLPAAASELWDEIVPILAEARVLNRVDRAALVALCLQWERGVVARRVLAQEGYFALGSTGQLVKHPALAIESEAHQLMLRFAEQFGITPVARARIAAAAAMLVRPDADELAGIIDAEPEPLDD